MVSTIRHIIQTPGLSSKTVRRYILLQIPSFLLLIVVLGLVSKPLNLPLWSVLIIILMWILKDFIMFFFVWRAYVPSGGSDPTKMIGKTGTTREVLNPSGYIQIDGELWYAELMDKKLKTDSGIKVIVREAHGLTLFVEILN